MKDVVPQSSPIASFWASMFPEEKASSLGDVYDSSLPSQLFTKEQLISNKRDAASKKLRIAFRNHTPHQLVVCWIDTKGVPHHFYSLSPSSTRTPKDDACIILTTDDHIEQTYLGDAFCFALCDDIESSKETKTVDKIIGGYRPTTVTQEEPQDDGATDKVHVVTIREKSKLIPNCFPKRPADEEYIVSVTLADMDLTPIDTSDKEYIDCTLGGWPCKVQDDWHGGDLKLEQLLERHIEVATKCLPPHAYRSLRKNTPIYINKSIQYGPQLCPINGKGMCFHPGNDEWLRNMGMSTDKSGCVEIYNASDYWTFEPLWGVGGVLLHEFVHAYHYKLCTDGYENADIMACYEAAMKDGLYDCVKVHGTQGPTAKAYASVNQMEYFAELSVAFLGGLDDREYNKWQPFNRRELKSFDKRAFDVLQKVWKVTHYEVPVVTKKSSPKKMAPKEESKKFLGLF